MIDIFHELWGMSKVPLRYSPDLYGWVLRDGIVRDSRRFNPVSIHITKIARHVSNFDFEEEFEEI